MVQRVYVRGQTARAKILMVGGRGNVLVEKRKDGRGGGK